MPLRLRPPSEPTLDPAKESTKKVRLTDAQGQSLFEESGPFEEYFTVLDYLHESVHEAARKAATSTVTGAGGKGTREEYTHAIYVSYLIEKQLRNWRLIAPPCPPHMTDKEYRERTYAETEAPGLRFWKFLPVNVAELPWDARGALLTEILACGGVIPTRGLIVKTAKGLELDFRHQDAGLGAREGTGD